MNYPRHVAIIPDGNRTRARQNNKSTNEAYLISYQRGIELMKYTFIHTDIEVFTLRGLSTENAQKRPKEEFDFLMTMYKLIDNELDDFLLENNINFKRIGNGNGITEDFKKYLDEKTLKTKNNSNRYMVFGVNYGGRDEIIRGVQNLYKKTINNNIEDLSYKNIEELINEQTITENLDLGNIKPVELVIRTKGDEAQRTSGFMSRRIGYAELYFTSKKCPEFIVKDYKNALERFDSIYNKRNYGK